MKKSNARVSVDTDDTVGTLAGKIELAGLDAWPAVKQEARDGWIVRYGGGFTKRANSVTVLNSNHDSIESQISRCELTYNRIDLPCVFRLLSFNDNQRLELALNKKGYSIKDHSRVLTQPIGVSSFPAVNFESLTAKQWMGYHTELSRNSTETQTRHLELIGRIKGTILLAVLRENERTRSCGLGVISNGYFGIFSIVTNPDYRRSGFGVRLIKGMLAWAAENKAHTAFTQVEVDNEPAVRLYQKLGYRPCYEYYYRIQDR